LKKQSQFVEALMHISALRTKDYENKTALRPSENKANQSQFWTVRENLRSPKQKTNPELADTRKNRVF
jgi:hypothetical protein